MLTKSGVFVINYTSKKFDVNSKFEKLAKERDNYKDLKLVDLP